MYTQGALPKCLRHPMQCNAPCYVIVQLPLYSRSCMLHPIDIVHQGQGGKRSNRVSIRWCGFPRPNALCAAISACANSVLHRAHFASSCIPPPLPSASRNQAGARSLIVAVLCLGARLRALPGGGVSLWFADSGEQM